MDSFGELLVGRWRYFSRRSEFLRVQRLTLLLERTKERTINNTAELQVIRV